MLGFFSLDYYRLSEHKIQQVAIFEPSISNMKLLFLRLANQLF